MDFRFANLKRLPLLAGAVVAVSFVQAQTLVTPGQPIIFSAPDDGGDAASSTPSLAPQPSSAPGFEDMVRAPEFNFKNFPASGTQPPVPLPRTVAPAEDPRANWALMTPAEIMGVVTPEQILKIPERDAAGRRKNLTVVERYYARQDQAQTNGYVGFLPGMKPMREDYSDNEHGRSDTNGFNTEGGDFGNPAQWADSFQKPAPAYGAAASRNGDADWSRIFISPPPPVQNQAQEDNMTEFQKLLEPGRPSQPSSGDGFSSSPQPPPVSAFGQPANPASLGSFNNGIGGLPGVAGQAAVPVVATVPDWKPQPAPWMLQGPQPGVIPKRKF
jgi:hypothetical protein